MENKKKKIHRFIVPEVPDGSEWLVTDAHLIHQWKNVLRFAPGEKLQLVAYGAEIDASIKEIRKDGILLNINSVLCIDPMNAKAATMYVGMFKKAPFEWMLEKLTEVGVDILVPMETSRTVRFPWKRDRFEAIVREAAEQCGRRDVMTILEPMTFAQALEHAKGNTDNYIFDIGEKEIAAPTGLRLGGFIGPEGGFTKEEIAKARDAGVHIAGLGDLTLRAETASIIAAYELLK